MTIDIGTSFAKVGVFTDGELLEKRNRLKVNQLPSLVEFWKPDRIAVSSVTIDEKEVKEALSAAGTPILYLSETTALPISISYETPETLGTDRLAAVVGAQSIFPEEDVLVIDAGTCITYDFLDKEGSYQGGSISPGFDLKFRALNNYTARLPLLEKENDVDLTGRSTRSSILSGVIWGTLAEITEIIRMYHSKLPNLRLVICGGDAEYIKNHLEVEMTYAEDLVLKGLNRIQEYNE